MKQKINDTLDAVKNSLLIGDIPSDNFFETDENIVIFSLKEIDDDIAFSVGVCKKDTDVLFSNFIYTADKNSVKNYLDTDGCKQKTEQCIYNLSKKVKEHFED